MGKKEDRKFATELAIATLQHFNCAKLKVSAYLSVDKPKLLKSLDMFGAMLLYAYKRGEVAARAVVDLEQPIVEPTEVTHIEIRATKRVFNSAAAYDVVWCTEEEAEDYSVYRGAPGCFNWVADFGKKDDALEYAEMLGAQHEALVSNRIGEV